MKETIGENKMNTHIY